MKKQIAFLAAAVMLIGCLLCAPVLAGDNNTAPERANCIALINASVNENDFLVINEDTVLLARAVLPNETYCVDHWEINGGRVSSRGRLFSLEFSTRGTEVVMAVLRECRSVSCENSYFRFFDADGEPAGSKYSRYYFEYDYEIPTTGESYPGGYISGSVAAVVPAGQVVDYWLINGVPVRFGQSNVSVINFAGLNKSCSFEPVFRDVNKAGTPVQELTLKYDVPKNPVKNSDEEGLANPMPVEYHEHSFSYVPENGLEHHRVCECGLSTGEEHTLSCTPDGDETHTLKCEVCGYSAAEKHYTDEPVSSYNTLTYICDVCGRTYKTVKLK